MKESITQRNPFPTVDIIIEIEDGIVLVERKNPPHGWAIPGGFIDVGESAEEAAIREAFEETGLKVELTDLLGVYSAPGRDPRFHTISVIFTGIASGTLVAGDDAAGAAIFRRENLPKTLVFDHKRIIEDYCRFKATGLKPGPAQNRS